MNAGPVVLMDSDFDDCDVEMGTVNSAGLEFIDARALSDADRRVALRRAAGLLVQYERVERELIDDCPNLRVVVPYGVGTDMIDVDAARMAGVQVRPVLDYCVEEVADHALALVLACTRRVPVLSRAVKRGEWPPTSALPRLTALTGQQFSVVGYGSIGRAVARRARAFGANVQAHDPAVHDHLISSHGVTPTSLRRAFQAEVVSLHLPLVPETRGMVDADLLSLLPDGAVLVNVSRGAIVDETALLAELDDGRILAGLDVLGEEPPSATSASGRLAGHPNVVPTPHVAWYSAAAIARLRQQAAALVVETIHQARSADPKG